MKILQIINSLGTGGAEKLLLDLLPKYNALGIQMDILLLWDNNHSFTKALKALKCCKVYILSSSAHVKDVYKMSHLTKMRRIMKDYDIAHVHLFPAQYFAVFANILNGNKTKLVFTEHNTTNSRISKSYFKPLERFIYRRYQHLVCISTEIENIYINYLKFPSYYYQVIENGVDITRIHQAIPLDRKCIDQSLNADDILILQVSAFRPQKDQFTAIKAMVSLPDQAKLLLVGSGEMEAKCKDLAISLGIEDRIVFLGQRMDVPELLVSADIVLLSSHYEGLSLSSIEGMASGKPFVASDVPGLTEIVKGAGVLFQHENAEDLSSKLMELLTDFDLYQHVVTCCLKRSEEYDITKMMQKHIDLYHQLLS